jgi:hypothetical protein
MVTVAHAGKWVPSKHKKSLKITILVYTLTSPADGMKIYIQYLV